MEPRLKVLLRPQDLTGQVLPVALIFRHYNHISNLVLLLFGGTLGNVLLLPTYVFFLLCTSEPFYLRAQDLAKTSQV